METWTGHSERRASVATVLLAVVAIVCVTHGVGGLMAAAGLDTAAMAVILTHVAHERDDCCDHHSDEDVH